MAQTLTEAKITTRTARLKLKPGVHWREIDSGAHIHLGYRKGPKGGRWLVRWYAGDQRYKQRTLSGAADDTMDADGAAILAYAEAERAARQTVADEHERAALQAAGPIVTVRSAIADYIASRDARDETRNGRRRASSANRLTRYVVEHDPRLADTPLHILTKDQLKHWRTSMSKVEHREGSTLASTSVQRVCNDLRAALVGATDNEAVRSNVTAGLRKPKGEANGTSARPSQVLTDEQVRNVITAAAGQDEDYHRLVLVLAATGARFAQVRRLTVGDVLDGGRLMMPGSFKGQSGQADKAPVAVPIGLDVMAALQPAVVGRRGDEYLLERWTHRQVAPMVWERGARGPWQTASELTRKWDITRKAAGLDPDTIPYALRHSSIVRGIRANLPIRLVAALHDTSIAMIERHYARWITDSLDELAAQAVVRMVSQ